MSDFKDKALVLSSGGVDSTTCVAMAVERFGSENVSTVSVYYGQKHSKELECAKAVADYYHVKHYEMDLSPVMAYSDCSLLEHSDKEIEHSSYAEQLEEKGGQGIVDTYVPFRNGLMMSSAAALAMSLYPEDKVHIYLGAHADDAAGNAYPDCSRDFTDTMGRAIELGTGGHVVVEAPLVNWNKAGVVKEGLRLNAPYILTWSCYEGGSKACGKCATCIDRLEAFRANGVEDPIEYQE